MSLVQSMVLRLRRAETPALARLKRGLRAASRFNLPIPFPFVWLFGLWHLTAMTTISATRRFLSIVYREPLFRSWCAKVGSGLYLEQIPHIRGNVHIELGDDVTISGVLVIAGGRTFDESVVVIGDRVFLGHRLTLQVAQRIVIEEGAGIAADCFIADHDGHPSDLAQRLAGFTTPRDEVRPVRIERNAWVGRGSSVLKGVTIGEGAVIGVGSVVVSDVPAFTIAMGNPARVVRRSTQQG